MYTYIYIYIHTYIYIYIERERERGARHRGQALRTPRGRHGQAAQPPQSPPGDKLVEHIISLYVYIICFKHTSGLCILI